MELSDLMEHFYFTTDLRVASNQDMLLFKLLSFWGVLLTETCYQTRRATARDFTVPIKIADNFTIAKKIMNTRIDIAHITYLLKNI